MATIKDVAKKANVSIGTVSNVINGKTKNEELIARVEKAIEELDFRMNVKAKSLKTKNTYMIGVVVDSLERVEVGLVLEALEQKLGNAGYSLIIKTVGKNAILERKQIDQLLRIGVDGIVIMTQNPNKKWEKLAGIEDVQLVSVDRPLLKLDNISIIYMDYERAVEDFFCWCEKKNYANIALLLGPEIIDKDSLNNMLDKHRNLQVQYEFIGNYSAESGFKAASEALYKNKEIEVFFIGNKVMESGVFQATTLFGRGKEVHYVCVKNGKWLEDTERYKAIVDVSFLKLGEMAAEKMLERLKGNSKHLTVDTVTGEFKLVEESRHLSNYHTNSMARSLNVAILNADTAKILKRIADVYEKENNINIVFHCLEYHDLWNLIINPERMKNLKIDVFMYDILWKGSLVQQNILGDISSLEEHAEYFENYIENIVEVCGRKDGKLYGLPFLTGTQLLFYQKDLFVDEMLQIQFQRMFGYPLKVPSQLDEYLDVAKFFTRKFNSKSPVQYGTSIVNQGNLYNSIEFLNRLWTYNTDVIKDGCLNIDTEEFRLAAEKYRDLYQYTKQESRISSWEDIAEEFKNGKTAMVQLYDSYAFDLNNYEYSKVAGNIDCAIVAGKSPISGGWGLGVYANSNNAEQAKHFIEWVCGAAYDKFYSILAGISNRKDFYENKDLELMYPWNRKVLKSYQISKNRQSLLDRNKKDVTITFYDEILGKILGKILCGQTGIEEGIKTIQEETKKLQEKI